ncbi:hypothetical protein AAF712_009004 [Marasmius tenuissimus]|uniref:Uncharacterized protein n=1 Tax=Marasmius tenuissimus TaxID=585030 RepID=A0ABR2ZTE4_9AGAR
MPAHQKYVHLLNSVLAKCSLQIKVGSKPLDIEDLDELYGDKYDKMSDKDKQDLVKKYEAEVLKEEREKIKISQPNARSRAQDIAHLHALALRVGIEAMFMIVRNHHDPFMAQTFGWTNEKLCNYMPLAVASGWKTERVQDDWVEGCCRFRKLSPEEHVVWKKAYDEKVKNKEIELKIRKTRKDAGTKRTKPRTASSETADVEMENVEDEEDDGSVQDDDGGVQDGVGVAATIGDLGNADVEMEDGTSTSGPAASSSIKAAKAKKKAGKSGANKAKEKKEKAEAAASKAQKRAKVQVKESATHPAPTAKACPKPQEKTRPADSGDAEPAIPPPIISPTESLPPPISKSLPPPISELPL